MPNLYTDITQISRVGTTTAKRLKKIGINTAEDLLFYFPYRYDDYAQTKKISELKIGDSANIVGTIELIQNKRSFRKKMSITEALVSDESESIKVIWFNQPFIAKNLRVGDRVSLAGKIDGYGGDTYLKSPVYEKLISNNTGVHTQGIVPNYHLTLNITQKQIRFLISQIINLADKITDWLPDEITKNLELLSQGEAIKKIHFPQNQSDIEAAQKRLSFNELFLIQLQSQLSKRDFETSKAKSIKFKERETKNFVDQLPFKLTNAQKKAAWEIIQDMTKDSPMTRLLEGDVGSGKTVVAALAMLNAALNGKQSALMVPTEILAKQHFTSITKLFQNTNIKIGLITGSEKKISDNDENHNSQFIIQNSSIIIGTHALIQEKIMFKDLSLCIIDEQHRFGVEQKKELMNKSGNRENIPHLLSMTATPIPRSLALALYGDLDLSIINQMPLGRKKNITSVVPEFKRQDAYNFIKKQITDGRQVFVVCPLIDLSDKLGVKSVKEEFKKLDKEIFPDLKIGLLHGRMKATEKEETMNDFLENKIKILVSTSVIEVGVDVPNASVIMIEGADRFGLAQLHQFRGRVGRSDHQSYCLLFTDNNSPQTMSRLKALETNHDGFALAQIDLKFRGPGEVYGTAQKGFPELKIASLFNYDLMKKAQEEAIKIINQDPQLKNFPLLKEKLNQNSVFFAG